MDVRLITRVAGVTGVPPRIIGLTTVATAAGIAFGIVQGWPAWGFALLIVAMTAPVLALETAWVQEHHGWLALFYVLVVTQLGHLGEHVAQMVQIHVLGRTGADARGIFGQLDIEWVHFVWNTWVLVAVALLAWRFRRNGWLVLGLVFAGWHEAEHIFIMNTFIGTGQPGTPGLLAEGGRIAGGIGLARPDLHFLYNVVETTPLVIAFVWQIKRAYDTWIAQAFPTLPPELLVEATARATVERVAPGTIIVEEGTVGDRMYVIAKGEVDVLRGAPLRQASITTLGPGRFFGEVALLQGIPRTATVRARTAVELLALDKAAFLSLVERSQETGDSVRRLVRERLTTG